jgi:hypothetical protein
MPEWASATLKWLAALLGMALIVVVAVPRALDELSQAITFGDEGLLGEADSPLDADPIGGEQAAAAVISVRDGEVAALGAESLTLGADEDVAVLLFEPVPTDPACLIEVALQVPLLEAAGQPGMRVLPADSAALAGLQEGEAVPPEAALDSDERASGGPGEDADVLRWTVTGPFAASAAAAGPEAPAALSVALQRGAEGSVTIGTLPDDPEAGPLLTWSAVADCPGVEEPPDA